MVEESKKAKRDEDSWGGQLKHLAQLAGDGGYIAVGTLEPRKGVAVAGEGTQVHAALRRRSEETLDQLLRRLNDAVGKAVPDAPIDYLGSERVEVIVMTRKRTHG